MKLLFSLLLLTAVSLTLASLGKRPETSADSAGESQQPDLTEGDEGEAENNTKRFWSFNSAELSQDCDYRPELVRDLHQIIFSGTPPKGWYFNGQQCEYGETKLPKFSNDKLVLALTVRKGQFSTKDACDTKCAPKTTIMPIFRKLPRYEERCETHSPRGSSYKSPDKSGFFYSRPGVCFRTPWVHLMEFKTKQDCLSKSPKSNIMPKFQERCGTDFDHGNQTTLEVMGYFYSRPGVCHGTGLIGLMEFRTEQDCLSKCDVPRTTIMSKYQKPPRTTIMPKYQKLYKTTIMPKYQKLPRTTIMPKYQKPPRTTIMSKYQKLYKTTIMPKYQTHYTPVSTRRGPYYTRTNTRRAPDHTRTNTRRDPYNTTANPRRDSDYTTANTRRDPYNTQANTRGDPYYTQANTRRAPDYTRTNPRRDPDYTTANTRRAPDYTTASWRAPDYTTASWRASAGRRIESTRGPQSTRRVHPATPSPLHPSATTAATVAN